MLAKIHPGHCACPQQFNQSNIEHPWVERKKTYAMFDICGVKKIVILPRVGPPAPMCTQVCVCVDSTQILKHHML